MDKLKNHHLNLLHTLILNPKPMASITPTLLPFPSSIAKPPTFPPLRPSPPLSLHPRRTLRLSAAAQSDSSAMDAVVNPALFNANLMYFQAGYNVQIVVDEGESEEALLRRFRREVSKAGVIQECKRRRYFENKQEEKKRKAREAVRKNRRRRTGSGPRFPSASPNDNDSTSKRTVDDDNWDMPEGDLPY